MQIKKHNAKSAAARSDRVLRFFPSRKDFLSDKDLYHRGSFYRNHFHGGFPYFGRRPLFTILAVMAAAIGICIFLFPYSLTDYEAYRGKRVTLTGTVCGIEQKMEGDALVWRMMLSDVRTDAYGFVTESTPESIAESATESTSESIAESVTEPIPDSVADGVINPGKRDRVLCVLDHAPEVDISARVQLQGTLYPFRSAMNEGEFDLRRYYHILRVSFSLRDVDILAASAPTDKLAASLFHLKNNISDRIDSLFSTRNSAVLKAMILGEKGLLEEETRELYQGAGIVHILSVSGLHLSLIGIGLFSLTGKIMSLLSTCIPSGFAVTVRAGLSIIAVFLYGKMIGMGTSAFRALVMLSLYIISKVIGRTYDALTAAGIASILLLFDQPLYLLHTGFQFSFGAVLAIGILLPALPGRALKTAAIPLVTLPVYLWSYGTFPVFSLLLNMLVIPLMTVVMISAGGSVLFDALAGILPVSRIIGLPSELILDFYRFLAETSSGIPGHEIVPGRPSAMQILLFYSMLCFISVISIRLQMPHMRWHIEAVAVSRGEVGCGATICGAVSGGVVGYGADSCSAVSHGVVSRGADEERDVDSRRYLRGKESVPSKMDRLLLQVSERICLLLRLYDNRERKIFACICTALWLVIALFVLTFRRQPAFEMDMLYVGQGDGIFISSEGRNFLIDGGSSTKEELAKYTLLPFLHCKGVSHLDGIIISHEDGDHCSGLLEFLGAAAEEKPGISISALYLPDIAEETKGENYLRIEELSEQAGIPVRYISCGQRIRAGSLTMDCLHPARGASYTDANEYSTTLLLRYTDPASKSAGTEDTFSALLTGDIEGEGEKDLCAHLQDLNISVLKVAHHGSRNATSEEFLKYVHPQVAVISAGAGNLYGHPHDETIQRLESCNPCPEIYRTDQAGEISMRWEKKKGGWDMFVQGYGK